MQPYDLIILINQAGSDALDTAEENIKKANEVLEGLLCRQP